MIQLVKLSISIKITNKTQIILNYNVTIII